jgi:hypothetical protein
MPGVGEMVNEYPLGFDKLPEFEDFTVDLV